MQRLHRAVNICRPLGKSARFSQQWAARGDSQVKAELERERFLVQGSLEDLRDMERNLRQTLPCTSHGSLILFLVLTWRG